MRALALVLVLLLAACQTSDRQIYADAAAVYSTTVEAGTFVVTSGKISAAKAVEWIPAVDAGEACLGAMKLALVLEEQLQFASARNCLKGALAKLTEHYMGVVN